jgi:hypothetical protein
VQGASLVREQMGEMEAAAALYIAKEARPGLAGVQGPSAWSHGTQRGAGVCAHPVSYAVRAPGMTFPGHQPSACRRTMTT